MSYVCYTRHEGRGLVEVQPTITLRFDNMHKITRNRLIKVLEENYNPYGYSSKVSAITDSVKHILPVSGSVLDADVLATMPEDTLDTLAAKALMIDHKIERQHSVYRGDYWIIDYRGPHSYGDATRSKQYAQVISTYLEALKPFRLMAWHSEQHKFQQKLIKAIENQAPFTIEGQLNKRY